jgi:serine/threonine protein kinase
MPATITLQHYEVLTRADGSPHELGRGAMGITYKGIDTRLRVPVALKVINAAHLHSETARLRFVREARAAARLRHRNVASVFHLGEEGGNYFYAMEYIDGETVDALVKRQGPLPPVLALRITAQVARALNAAQTHELVHRDIKPSNLMAVLEDDDLVVKVIDFGLAKASVSSDDSAAASITHGGFLGTPHFASPEQLEERDIDVRADIYSLGVTLWYLLRGSTPFKGSVARVVGQHLTKQPPFEELAALPQPVVDLLRKMLEKDPARRQQTPAALRKEIEHCLKLIQGPGTRPIAAAQIPSSPTASDVTSVPDDLQFETGATIGHRYLITEDLGENEAGDNFRARDLQQDRDVRLLLFFRELLADSSNAAQIEREAATLTALIHPQVLEVFDLASAGRNTFLTLGWTDGFTLRELLRTRRELKPAEVTRLLDPAATGLDYALAANIESLELGLHHVLVHFPKRETAIEELLQQPVSSWPAFVVKINPLATWRDLFMRNWAAGQTLVGGSSQEAHRSSAGRAGTIRALAAIAYELLGGVAAASSTRDYTPLAALDEAGNAVLHRALFAPESFASAEEFMRHFSAPSAADIESAARTTSTPAEAPQNVGPAPLPEPVAEPVSSQPTLVPVETVAPVRHDRQQSSSQPTLAPPEEEPVEIKPRRSPALAWLAVLVVVTAGFAAYHFTRSQPEPTLIPRITPSPTPYIAAQTPHPTIRPATPPLPTIRPSTPPLPTVRATTPPPPTIRPTTPVPPTPAPTPPPPPTRRELATTARQAAESLEARQANREALSAWLRMAKDFPEFDTGRVGLELLLNRLRRRPGGLTPAEFAAMQADIRPAAGMGVIAAMMILADELRPSDPAESFAWYCAAAEGGEPLAMTQAGNMLATGTGTAPDSRKAFQYFDEAAKKNEPNAIAALGEAYLLGEGVEKDEAQAISLLKKASEKGVPLAKNLLGLCYHKGVGVERNDREAFRLFTEAAERGLAEAFRNLGVLYMKGEGVVKNATKAVEKLKEGSLKGDAESMFLYAQCFDNGFGTKPNPDEARKWFRKAAEAGHAAAAEWCRSNGVSFKPAP